MAFVVDTSKVVSITGTFLTFVGETVAELKRQEFARIDADLLRLKRTLLAEGLEDFKAKLQSTTEQEKAKAEQDLISRGLANTTVRQSTLRALEQDAANELDKAVREYNRGIEEIALMERRLKEDAVPKWRRLVRCLGFSRI